MSLTGQTLKPDRYQLVPRTLSFLIRPREVLLLRLPPADHAWSGLLNGVGGHIELGENPQQGAAREILEETGLEIDELRLCGVIIINLGTSPGIGLYVYVGTTAALDAPSAGEAGEPGWYSLQALGDLPLVPDLPQILPRALKVYEANAAPFSALYSYSPAGELIIDIEP